MKVKKRIHHLMPQMMNSNSELFPNSIQIYNNTSEYIKSIIFYSRECLILIKLYMMMVLIVI